LLAALPLAVGADPAAVGSAISANVDWLESLSGTKQIRVFENLKRLLGKTERKF
jgi:hypothetical protein